MVLSDHSYQVKVALPQGKHSDDDRIQITFKVLAGNEDDEPIGKKTNFLIKFCIGFVILKIYQIHFLIIRSI